MSIVTFTEINQGISEYQIITRIIEEAKIIKMDNMKEDFIKKYKTLNNILFYRIEKLSNEFLEHIKDEIDWIKFSIYYNYFNDELINRFSDYLDWTELSLFQNLSENVISENIDKINWNHLSVNKNININVYSIFHDKVNWENISYYNENITDSFINKNCNYLNWELLSTNYDFSFEMLERYADLVDWEQILYKIPKEKINDLVEKFGPYIYPEDHMRH